MISLEEAERLAMRGRRHWPHSPPAERDALDVLAFEAGAIAAAVIGFILGFGLAALVFR